MNYYLRHLGDYAKSAAWLSQTEHGALNLLLDWYYSDEKPIPADMIFHITKAHTREEKRAAEKVIKQHRAVWSTPFDQRGLLTEAEKNRRALKNAA